MIDFTSDGHDYRATFNHDTGVLEVFACRGSNIARIANGEFCDHTESFYYSTDADTWFEETGEQVERQEGASSDIYHNCTPQQAAEWLVGTYWQ